ncbi:MAG: carboxypeptidase-like regulatory domain-containing protein [Bacteroidia bacterium]|nr:carboxypeptidase-like regulatory domain-containing protein [Bacteroidia bacterium]
MVRNIILSVFTFLACNYMYAQSGTLKGTVKDQAKAEPIPFANVSLFKGSSLITGGATDFDGNYTIKPIPPGTYTVKCSYVGFTPRQTDGVIINTDKITFLNFDMSSGVQITQVNVYTTPLIDPDQVTTGGQVSQEEIKKMPGRSAEAVAVTVAGVFSQDGNISSIRGAREEGTVYYIDGVKVRGSNALPKSAIADVNVMTGGIPAKYGDATGGIISISTTGPSKELYGGVDLVTSQFLDPYGYNLVELSASGPLLNITKTDKNDTTKTRKEPIAGFFISGNFSYMKDGDPRAIGIWTIKDDSLSPLMEEPTRINPQGFGVLYNANWLKENSFEQKKNYNNNRQLSSTFSGKFDVKLTDFINVTVGGSFDYSRYKDMWCTLDNRNYLNSLLNYDNNGLVTDRTWRTYARLTQRFADKTPSKEEATALNIKNAFYRIQFDYSKRYYDLQDAFHKDNLFNYGHVGKFTTSKINSYEFTDTLAEFPDGVYMHTSADYDTAIAFEPSAYNPDLARYTESYYEKYPPHSEYYMNATTIEQFGALLNGQYPFPIYGIWTSPGTPYNDYTKADQRQFRMSVAGSADVKDHEISVGFEFEQRKDALYSVTPMDLWILARQLTNVHILELDREHPLYSYSTLPSGETIFTDTVYYNRLYSQSTQREFDIKLREHLGLPINGTDWIDVDALDPSELSIDYFSAEDLLNSGNPLIGYYGYDHHGKKLRHKPSFAEFFTETDEYGMPKREIAPFEPTYAAAYLQDKFGFRDLVFNIGLRIDRYDANQMVPKDPYVLREVYKAGDQPAKDLTEGSHPQGIGDDYVVYVNDIKNPSEIMGYRDGDNWYNANGTPIDDYNDISTSKGIAPYLVNPNQDYLNEKAFEDYKPQITPMPRISFSFPISDVALFFTHYDVLSIRPTEGYNRMNPVRYYYIEVNPDQLANPNLKPQKTIDYEVGFQQKLNDNSTIKLSAFYREMRDMIQIISIQGGYPTNYTTYGNLDFGTVKGFSGSFQMRRAGNATIRANYILFKSLLISVSVEKFQDAHITDLYGLVMMYWLIPALMLLYRREAVNLTAERKSLPIILSGLLMAQECHGQKQSI